MKKLFAVILAISLLCASVAFADTALEGSTITIRQEDISGSTGYTWSWSMSAEGVLEMVNENVIANTEMPGATGIIEWTFKAVAPGDVIIFLQQTEPGEGDKDAITIDYEYKVNDDLTITLISTTAPVQFVEFAENPTTGYVWSYEATGDGAVNEITNEYYTEYAETEMVGAGGTHLWAFEGLTPGNVTLTFKYARSFEDTESAKTVVLEYVVDEASEVNFVSSTEPSAEIALIENPTTGYEWVLEYANYDIVSLIGDHYTPDENEEQLVGVGGVHHWAFHGINPGQTTVTFTYIRPWEDSAEPAAILTYTFTVAEDLSIEVAPVEADEASLAMIATVG